MAFRSLFVAALFCLVACSTGSSGSSASPEASATARGCTEEAKVCPDGSTVARQGPSCEFAPCPDATSASPSSTASSGAAACKDLCGNGSCEEMVCMAVGCPCAETQASCPQDCK